MARAHSRLSTRRQVPVVLNRRPSHRHAPRASCARWHVVRRRKKIAFELTCSSGDNERICICSCKWHPKLCFTLKLAFSSEFSRTGSGVQERLNCCEHSDGPPCNKTAVAHPFTVRPSSLFPRILEIGFDANECLFKVFVDRSGDESRTVHWVSTDCLRSAA